MDINLSIDFSFQSLFMSDVNSIEVSVDVNCKEYIVNGCYRSSGNVGDFLLFPNNYLK